VPDKRVPDKPRLLELMLGARLALAASLAGITVLCWLYLFAEAADMRAMGDMTMAMPPKGAVDLVLLLVMWWIMMIGMMLPSAAPMILTFATVNARRRARAQPWVPTTLFASGYVLAWGGFSIAATLAQWGLQEARLVTPALAGASRGFGAIVLIAVGLYQWTPLKTACLSQCQAPLAFIQRQGGFRREPLGSLGLGARHGVFCVGCCWALMALLFVGGVMNVAWIAAITMIVLLEKLTRSGPLVSRLAGAACLAAGAWQLVAAPG